MALASLADPLRRIRDGGDQGREQRLAGQGRPSRGWAPGYSDALGWGSTLAGATIPGAGLIGGLINAALGNQALSQQYGAMGMQPGINDRFNASFGGNFGGFTGRGGYGVPGRGGYVGAVNNFDPGVQGYARALGASLVDQRTPGGGRGLGQGPGGRIGNDGSGRNPGAPGRAGAGGRLGGGV